MNIKKLTLPVGYSIETETVKYELSKGLELFSKEYLNAYKATIVEDKLLVDTKHWCCPYCRTKNRIKNYYQLNNPEDIIDDCAQTSLFNDGAITIYDYDMSFLTDELDCKVCGNSSQKSNDFLEVVITQNKKVIKVMLIVNDIKELVNSGINGDIYEMVINLPLYKALTFDFNKHQVYSSIEKKDNTILLCEELDCLKGNSIALIIDKYYQVKEVIMDMLKSSWQTSLDFDVEDINSAMIKKLIDFSGYPVEFYNDIPCDKDSGELYPTFNKYKKYMNNYSSLDKVYAESLLPNFKSIRKIFFKNPMFFFYLEEISFLWRIVNNGDYLRRILTCDEVNFILASLHIHPCVFEFIKEYAKFKSLKVFVKTLTDNPDIIISYGMYFSTLREDAKEVEKEKWNNCLYNFYVPACLKIPFQLCVKILNSSFDDDINGYSFKRVLNEEQFKRAGIALNNCLKDYDSRSNPVVLVRCVNTKKLIAAIEIKDNYVVQAYAKDNELISLNPELEKTVIEYFCKHDLDYSHCEI